MHLADGLVVGEIDADRRHRSGITTLDDHVDGARGHADDVSTAIGLVVRHVRLEPGGVLGDAPDVGRLLRVLVEDDAFPRALATAGIEVHLDEAVDRVDGRSRIGHPRDVVRATILLRPRPIEADECLERRTRGRWRDSTRGLEVRDHASQRRPVAAADTVHVLAQRSVGFLRQARVERETAPRSRRGRAAVTSAYRLFALAARMSSPGAGVLLVTIGRHVSSRKSRAWASTNAAGVAWMPRGTCWPLVRTVTIAVSNCSRDSSSTNLRDVMCS